LLPDPAILLLLWMRVDLASRIRENIEVLPRVGLWRSWERASMAWKRSSVRSRSGPPNNPLQIKHMPEAENSLLSVFWCHLVSNAKNAFGDLCRLRRFLPTSSAANRHSPQL